MAIHFFSVSSDQNLSAERAAIAESKAKISHDADEIYFNNPEKLYIYDKSIISGTSLFLDMDLRGCGNNALMWGGTGVFSTTFYEKIARFGYDEFFSSNLFDERVYYITTDADVWNSSFMQYMKKCYGESVDAELMESTEAGVCVYKFIR